METVPSLTDAELDQLAAAGVSPERIAAMRSTRDASRTCTTCGYALPSRYVNAAAGEACADPIHGMLPYTARRLDTGRVVGSFVELADAERWVEKRADGDELEVVPDVDLRLAARRGEPTVAELDAIDDRLAARAELELVEQLAQSFEVILPNGDRAQATDAGAIVLAARLLRSEAAEHGASSAWLRRNLIVTVDGVRHAALTERAAS